MKDVGGLYAKFVQLSVYWENKHFDKIHLMGGAQASSTHIVDEFSNVWSQHPLRLLKIISDLKELLFMWVTSTNINHVKN